MILEVALLFMLFLLTFGVLRTFREGIHFTRRIDCVLYTTLFMLTILLVLQSFFKLDHNAFLLAMILGAYYGSVFSVKR